MIASYVKFSVEYNVFYINFTLGREGLNSFFWVDFQKKMHLITFLGMLSQMDRFEKVLIRS